MSWLQRLGQNFSLMSLENYQEVAKEKKNMGEKGLKGGRRRMWDSDNEITMVH